MERGGENVCVIVKILSENMMILFAKIFLRWKTNHVTKTFVPSAAKLHNIGRPILVMPLETFTNPGPYPKPPYSPALAVQITQKALKLGSKFLSTLPISILPMIPGMTFHDNTSPQLSTLKTELVSSVMYPELSLQQPTSSPTATGTPLSKVCVWSNSLHSSMGTTKI